jgi:hypothetical protein
MIEKSIFSKKKDFVDYVREDVIPLVCTYDKDFMLELFGMIEVLYWVDGFRHPAFKNVYETKEDFSKYLFTMLPTDDELKGPGLCPTFIEECIYWLNKE